MSLTVSPDLIKKARAKKLSDEEFYQCIKVSLPFAVDVIHSLVHKAEQSSADMAEFAPATLAPEKRGELLRAMASDAIKGALTKRFSGHQKRARGITLAFKNCHIAAVFLDTPKGRAARKKWSTPEAQILAQSPARVDC